MTGKEKLSENFILKLKGVLNFKKYEVCSISYVKCF